MPSLLSPPTCEKNLKSRLIFSFSVDLKILAACCQPYLGESNSTDAPDELLFGDEAALVVVELLEETFPPVPVLVEEQQEVLQVDLVVGYSLRQVQVHQVQNVDLAFRYYFLSQLRIERICCIASGGNEIGLVPPMQPPISKYTSGINYTHHPAPTTTPPHPSPCPSCPAALPSPLPSLLTFSSSYNVPLKSWVRGGCASRLYSWEGEYNWSI